MIIKEKFGEIEIIEYDIKKNNLNYLLFKLNNKLIIKIINNRENDIKYYYIPIKEKLILKFNLQEEIYFYLCMAGQPLSHCSAMFGIYSNDMIINIEYNEKRELFLFDKKYSLLC